jgi:drug/metabolite transporter (DMT)-like permease
MTLAATDKELEAQHAGRRRGNMAVDALLFLMASIWAVNYSVLKFATGLVAPLALNAIRIPLAGAIQLLLSRSLRLPAVSPRDRLALLRLGMLGNGLYQIFFILGVARARVATTVLVLASGPALAALIGKWRGSERVESRGWAGIALQLAGVSLVVSAAAGNGRGGDSLLGGLLVLAAATCWALYTVLVQPYTERLPGLDVGAYAMLGGAPVVLIAGGPLLAQVRWTELPSAAYGAIAYSTLGAMLVAYLIWYKGVSVLGPTRTSMYSNLQPPLAMLVAWIWLGEVPSARQVAGAAAITAGLVLARWSASEPEAP